MEPTYPRPGCITILLHGPATLGSGGVRLLVAYVRHRRGAAPWDYIAADIFRGGQETLLIARPAPAVSVQLADYALPFLHKHFTD